MTTRYFASDNASPAHPAILEALARAGSDHAIAYGDDPLTEAVRRQIDALFGRPVATWFVYNGTGANVAALRAILRPWEAVICTHNSHIHEDEAGAAEALGGFKLFPETGRDGRLLPEEIERHVHRLGFAHTSQPRAVSITQATEVGTVYWPDQIAALADVAHRHGMLLHMDGARISNAAVAWAERERAAGRAVSPAAALRAVTVDAGVDLLSFGATKNGLAIGEAVIVFDRERDDQFPWVRKQTTQLHSKMRYIAAQFGAWLADDLWFDLAAGANARARRLAEGLESLAGFSLAYPREANGVFVSLPAAAVSPLQDEFRFYMWEPARSVARLMVSWDSDDADVERFLTAARRFATNAG